MGRHRRSAAAPAAEHHAAGDAGRHRVARRRKRSGTPVRTGLIGASAALAVGAVAVASGLLPGGDTYTVGGGTAAGQVRTKGAPDLLTQGASTTAPAGRGVGRADGPAKAESPTGSPSSASPSKTSGPTGRAKPSESPASSESAATEAGKSTAPAAVEKSPAAPTAAASTPAARRSVESTSAASGSTQAAVLTLVNQERAKVGCSPVTASASLASLAQDFSDDMAARGFFDHTDPDGRTPWDRASKAGVQGLGGENIARGQADAQAVMDSWMSSEGHRANILNCDYKTLGVGVHYGSGGPWWTQDFGF
ncbi:CAP domain-containing protein [Streptomyces sp. BE133]|uniref:CAP domain-containing protein n=1 Tax=Streptomyces sp. BE133 TaxID=3002523 RepID=UPI002E7A2804|nr:CAP domain-containing protein [Streptomyces sp. BE133]MEE1809553.1 CAP domain-containing protein [Streptomyces sp. BE133]